LLILTILMTPLALEVFLDISGAGICLCELGGCKVMSYGPIIWAWAFWRLRCLFPVRTTLDLDDLQIKNKDIKLYS